MTKEPRVVVRLIALWIIFMVAVGLMGWSGQQFAISLVKIASGSYGESGCSGQYCPPAMTFTSCLMAPQYPSVPPMGIGPGEGLAAPDQGAINKYSQDFQDYSKAYQKACEQDVMRSQGMQKSSSVTDIAGYSVLLLLGVIAAVVAWMAIKKSEMEG